MMNDERCVLVRYSRVVYHGVSILFRRTVEHHRYFIIEYGNVSDLGWDPPPMLAKLWATSARTRDNLLFLK